MSEFVLPLGKFLDEEGLGSRSDHKLLMQSLHQIRPIKGEYGGSDLLRNPNYHYKQSAPLYFCMHGSDLPRENIVAATC